MECLSYLVPILTYRPRRPLLADDFTIALYIQSLMDSSNSFSTINNASADIAFSHKIYLFSNHRTGAPKVCMERTTTGRKFRLSAKRVKEPFLWSHSIDFALPYSPFYIQWQNPYNGHMHSGLTSIMDRGGMDCLHVLSGPYNGLFPIMDTPPYSGMGGGTK